MTKTTSTTDKTYYGTAVVGNDCKACSTLGTVSTTNGVTCPGGAGTTGEPTVTCGAGKYWSGTTCSTCTAGYSCAGFTNVKLSSLSAGYGRTQCTGATYAGSGQSSCTPCPTGYTYSTTAGKTAATSCTIRCAAGTRVVSAGASSCTTPAGAWYAGAHTVSYNSVSPIINCSSGYNYFASSSYASPAYHSSASYCVKSVPGGRYLSGKTVTARYVRIFSTTENLPIREIAAYTSTTETGTNLLSGKTATGASSGASYATDGSLTNGLYALCPTGSTGCVFDIGASNTIGSITFDVAVSNYTFRGVTIQVSTNGSSWTTIMDATNVAGPSTTNTSSLNMLLANAQTVTPCSAGKYKVSHTVIQGSTSTCDTCTGATYSYSGQSSCTACPNGYNASTSNGKTGEEQCAIDCPAGMRVARPTEGCTVPEGSWYIPYGHRVNFFDVSDVSYCPMGYDNNMPYQTPDAHDSQDDCSIYISSGRVMPSPVTMARYIRVFADYQYFQGAEYQVAAVAEILAFPDEGMTYNFMENAYGMQGEMLGYATDGNYDNPFEFTICHSSEGGCIWELEGYVPIQSIGLALPGYASAYYGFRVELSEDGENWMPVYYADELLTSQSLSTHKMMIHVSGQLQLCTAGSAKGSHNLPLYASSSCDNCGPGTYSRTNGAASCTSCTTGSINTGTKNTACYACSAGTTTSGVGQKTCNATCSNSNSAVTSWETPVWNNNNTVTNLCKISGCKGGFWSNANAACAAAGTGYYSPEGAITRTDCPTGYVYGSTTNIGQSDCKIACMAGTLVAERFAQCTTPAGDWYRQGTDLVAYGEVSYSELCPVDFHASGTIPTGHDDPTDCVANVPAGQYVRKGIPGRYFRIKSSTSPTWVSLIDVYDDQWNNISNGVTAGDGTNLGNATNGNYESFDQYATCPTTGCIWDFGSVKNITHLWFSMGGANKTHNNVQIDISEDGTIWKPVIEPINLTNGALSTLAGMMEMSDLLNCNAGTAKGAHSVALKSTSECSACTAGTFSLAAAGTCTSCAVGAYNTGTGNTNCIPCQTGKTTSAVGQSSCNATCSNSNSYATGWDTAVWNNTNNTVNNLCKITGCKGGYWSNANAACTTVGVGNWSANNSIELNQCPSGLTTIGYGVGADEAGDCGRILHFGNNKIYLRSEKKWSPALNVKIGDTTYYGNMVQGGEAPGSLQIYYNSKQYGVGDDTTVLLSP